MAPNHESVVVEITSHSGVPAPSSKKPPALLVFPLIVPPGQPRNMEFLSAVLVSHVPVSCWLNDEAPSTVVEVEGARR